MTIVRNMHAAKTELSQLVAMALAGDTVIVARSGRPIVRLVPCKEMPDASRTPGTGTGSFTVSDDFDAPLPQDVTEGWYA
jgi:prevent-host-death family protein